MITINGKVKRNLQEQVGYNTEQIEKIFDFLDGLNVQDNVVVIDDIATPLTAEELVIVNRDVAFLVYGGQLYIKKSVSGSTAYFDVVLSISAGTIITFNTSEIQVNLSNGGMSLVTNSPATYSKAQIDTLLSAKADITYVDAQLALKANLSGANFTGDITAPNITENSLPYVYQKIETANYEYEYVYVGAVKNGNKLTLVVALNLTKKTGALDYSVSLGNILLPNSVYSRLYPTTIGLYPFLDVKDMSAHSSHTSSVAIKGYIEKTGGYAKFLLSATHNMVVDTKYYIRYEATFLLSDNLAS